MMPMRVAAAPAAADQQIATRGASPRSCTGCLATDNIVRTGADEPGDFDQPLKITGSARKSLDRGSTVDGQQLSVDPARLGACKEGRDGRDVVWGSKAAGWR